MRLRLSWLKTGRRTLSNGEGGGDGELDTGDTGASSSGSGANSITGVGVVAAPRPPNCNRGATNSGPNEKALLAVVRGVNGVDGKSKSGSEKNEPRDDVGDSLRLQGGEGLSPVDPPCSEKALPPSARGLGREHIIILPPGCICGMVGGGKVAPRIRASSAL